MKQLTCNYAIARFRPYRETGEFVNVGIVLVCPQVGYFSFLFEHRKHKRVTDFFPELDYEVFKAGLNGMMKELSRLSTAETEADHQYVLAGEPAAHLAAFKELVRVRETLFHFSEPATVLAADPRAKLKELFAFYIKRQFARDREYQERIMRNQIVGFLQKINLARFYKLDEPVGNESYKIVLPFVHFDAGKITKAIKPLYLAKSGPTEIYRHGDAWISAVKRLRNINCMPRDFLFTVKEPAENAKCKAAAREICAELNRLDTLTVPFADRAGIERFARV